MIESSEQFARYWEGVRHRTRRIAALIPEQHLEWRASTGMFTLGDIIRHLASIERDMYAENVQGHPSRYNGCGRELADGLVATLAFMDDKHAESLAIFRALTPEQLSGPSVTPAGAPVTTWKWLRAMVEHEAHHRGQLYMMLGMLGIKTPPLYGLTAEEVQARSVFVGAR